MAGGKIARMPRRLALTLVPAFYLARASCATNPVTGGQDFVLVSEAQELRIGHRPITDAERDAAKALTIKLVTAEANTRIADLAARSPLGRNAEGYLRLMNGLYPKGEPVAGQPLKIVQ